MRIRSKRSAALRATASAPSLTHTEVQPSAAEVALRDRRVHGLVLDEQHVAAEGCARRRRRAASRPRPARPRRSAAASASCRAIALDGLQHDPLRRAAAPASSRLDARPRWRSRRAQPARAPGAASSELSMVGLTAGIDDDDVSSVASASSSEQHGETERARVARERLGERRAAREDAHPPRRQRRLAARRGRGAQLAAAATDWNVEPTCGWLSTVMLPAHEVGELAADREPEPGAAEAARGRLVGLRERLEDLADASRIHADAGIASPTSSHPRALSPRPAATSARTTTSPAR